jgi:hypothetical protein
LLFTPGFDCANRAAEKIIKMKDSRILMKGDYKIEIFNSRRDAVSFSGCQIYYFCSMYLHWIVAVHV